MLRHWLPEIVADADVANRHPLPQTFHLDVPQRAGIRVRKGAGVEIDDVVPQLVAGIDELVDRQAAQAQGHTA